MLNNLRNTARESSRQIWSHFYRMTKSFTLNRAKMVAVDNSEVAVDWRE